MNETTRRFSSDETVEITGLTYRQIDYWCRVGAFGDPNRNTGSGHARRFSRRDLIAGRVLLAVSQITVALSRQGVANDRAAEVAEAVRATPQGEWLAITPDDVEIDPSIDLSTITEPLLLASIAQARMHVDTVLALEPSTERLAHA